MEKKISINMVDDALDFIEVDGVRYASPEDIPDAADRRKVYALLSMPGTDDADEGFDDAAFEKEFEAIQRETAKFPTLIFSVFGVVGAILLAIAIFSAINLTRTAAREQATSGKVVDTVERRSVDSQTRETQVYSYPVVEFTVPGGDLKRIELTEGSWPPSYHAGDAVTILVDPAQPEDARIKSFAGTLLFWLLPAITGFIGLVFLSISGGIFWTFRSRKQEAAIPSLP